MGRIDRKVDLFERKYTRIKSEAMTEAMRQFTNSPRPWTAYPADRIEVVARHFGLIPKNFMYVEFYQNTEELVFASPAMLDIPETEFEIVVEEKERVLKGVPEQKKLPPGKE